MRQKKRCLAALQTTSLLALAVNAGAENIFSLSSSDAQPLSGAVAASQQGGKVGLSLPDALRGNSPGLSAAPSYGLRFSHYPERHPNWGIGVDFTHYGVNPGGHPRDAGSGVWRSALAPEATPLDRAAQRFDQPQGVNVLSVSGIYRWREDGPTVGRLQPYVGVGLAWYRSNSDGTTPGFARPPVENTALGYHMLGGVRYHFTERAGAFFEAKFNSGNGLNAAPGDPDGGARSYHAVAGVSYSF